MLRSLGSDLRDLANPWEAELLHLDSQLEKVVQALALGLGLVDVVTPDVNTMSTDEDSIGVGVQLHGLLEVLGQVLLVRGILDDGNPQRIMIPQVALLGHATAEALDLLDVVDLEDLILTGALGLEQQRDEDGPLRVCVDAAASVAAGEGRKEQGRALRRLVAWRGAKVGPLAKVALLRGHREDVDVGVFHEFLLDARGSDVDEVTKPL